MELANFADADLRGSFSAAVMTRANLHGADLSNAMVDQVNLTRADISDAVLTAALCYASFADVDIGADFSDAILDRAQIKELCQRASVKLKTNIDTRDFRMSIKRVGVIGGDS